MRRARKLLAGLALATGGLGLLAGGVGSLAAGTAGASRLTSHSTGTIAIGSVNFSEAVVIAEIYGDVLQHDGFSVSLRTNLGARQEVVPALEHGALDIEPDYAGTLLLYFNPNAGSVANQISTTVPALKKDLAKYGATVLNPAKAIDANVFAITKATDEKYKLGPHPTLSQLKPIASQLVLGGPSECPQNATCELGLEKVYGLHFKSFQSTDEAGPITVAALKDDTVQVAEFFSSDGNIVRNHFVPLTDNLHLQAADNVIPVIRNSVDTAKVAAALNQVDSLLTTTALSSLNIKVNFQHESTESVAAAWVAGKHL